MGRIDEKYASLGGANSFLGTAVGGVEAITGGRRQRYVGGEIRVGVDNGTERGEAFEVHGSILAKHGALVAGGVNLGVPTSDELVTRDGRGRMSAFDGGVIVWRADLGAREVHGAIVAKWRALGGVVSAVGYPISDEEASPSGTRRNRFEFGIVQWTGNGMGAYEVRGAIYAKYQTVEATLGTPLTDETPTADGTGRFNRFKNGRIVWTPAGGAVIA